MSTIEIDDLTQKTSKIVCIGQNYVAHIEELGNKITDSMVIFNKPPSAISDQLVAFKEEPLHYEGEISFLIKNNSYIGVAFGLDITKRSLQTRLRKQSLPWERAKAFDGSAIFSRFVAIPESLDKLGLKLDVNGSTRQQGSVDLMLYKPKIILQELRSFMTLNDGDIVMTGTPKGVGQINSSDLFCGTIFNKEKPLVSATWRAI